MTSIKHRMAALLLATLLATAGAMAASATVAAKDAHAGPFRDLGTDTTVLLPPG
jgi:hypothetical protein